MIRRARPLIWLVGAIVPWLLACLIFGAMPAKAQMYSPPQDTSALQAQANMAVNSANAALNQIPPICSTVPAMDTTNGSAGTAAPCTPPADNSRPANVQLATATGGAAIVTASDGSFSGVWPRAWLAAPGYAHAEIFGVSTPYVCMIVTATVTAVTGKCSQAATTTLPGTLLALGGLLVNPFSAAPGGLTVKVIGRQ